MGVLFSLDDFGTGYSSLTYFHQLPISVLKIDQNFVRSMLDTVQDLDIVEGVLRLAAALQRPVVSEGVESVELGMMLRQLGCQYAQGYGIARPMPPDRVLHWLAEWANERVWHGLGERDMEATQHVDLDVSVFSHRMWLERIAHVLKHGDRSELPPMNDQHCQLGRWLKGVGKARYGAHPSFGFIPVKHQQVHELAAELVVGLDRGTDDQIAYRLEELEALGAELTALLKGLVRT